MPGRPRPPKGDDDSRREAHGLEFERVLFFSDAVFAIAITLLVIELRLPDLGARANDEGVAEALRDQLPRIFAYVLSFATISLYWLAHWRRYRHIERMDERLAAINLAHLGFIALIPFPTAIIGEHGDTAPAVILYAVNLSAAGVLGTVAWLYAARAGLIEPTMTPAAVRASAWRGLSVTIVMLGTLPLLPWLGPGRVELLWLLIFPVQYVIVHRSGQASS